ncbi:transmembrane anterior posterior transformation protein 1 homolog isoform X10 [Crotalus tigris]|uniref:transmembrane anterior posterior transformation protein 1 homolog isoform X10 n=1 Tax=Crotalus tigris TaxID=88082 RepID=UPI00192F5121|nr:transmembrane anterior posterior transformation protein 1 homolog isoform X10 [Crotalus tigris]
MAVRPNRCSHARERWARLVHSVSRGDDVLRGGGCFPQSQGAAVAAAVARAKMAGMAEAAPGGGDGAGGAGLRQGSPSEPSSLLLQAEGGQPRRSTFASGGDGHPPPCTETLGFYESDRHRKKQHRCAPSDLSLLRFINAELTRGYFLEHNEAKYTERRERVYTCMRIPRELEKLMIFGIFLCLDAFLYVFTLLPLRVFLAVFRFITLPCSSLRYHLRMGLRMSDRRLLQPAQVCDIFKGVILVICYFMMHYVDYSMMYHLIRGQSVIKLYIIYNMLEVADRLFSSFGQDILDALYWTATEPKERKRFVEIKGSVFKKFEKNNLFQMSNSDHLWVLFPDVCMVIASEVAVDIVKHAFITKFNDITADVYSEYKASLAFDFVSSRQKNAYTDYSDSVSRRMGFIPLPLAVLLIRVVTSSVKVQGVLSYSCVILFCCGLISLKVLNSIVLLGKSCHYVKEANMEEKLFNPPPFSTPGKSVGKPQYKYKSPQGLSTEEGFSASVTSQPVQPKENVAPQLVTSASDQFLTTPDGDEKEICQDSAESKFRSTKKDLLEIDRFTICGNRID